MREFTRGLLVLLGVAAAGCGGGDEVVINGRALASGQIEQIQMTYGQPPRPGDYWYDPVSGLYGVVGHPAFGFMLPGHDFGRPDADVSEGDTGVFINGRELPAVEASVWSAMLGAPIQPGRYWMDGMGNAGYEGSPLAVVNLFAAARQNGVGAAGGGDNFWSSRFSAGNFDQGNARGYVSVPGHGPVGYGFD